MCVYVFVDKSQWALGKCLMRVDAVVVLGFYIPPTPEVTGRWDSSERLEKSGIKPITPGFQRQ